VPQNLVDAATFAFAARSVATGSDTNFVAYVRAQLAAVSPLHEPQVREHIACELELKSNKCDQDAELHADERSPLLGAQSDALWTAAQLIRAGREANDG
jgi:hypothetical protein